MTISRYRPASGLPSGGRASSTRLSGSINPTAATSRMRLPVPSGRAGAAGAAPGADAGGKQDEGDVVDAEFTEVKDRKG